MMTKLTCWLTCVRDCGGRYAVDEKRLSCPKCGGLLDVEHDVEALRRRPADEWKRLFRRRAGEPGLAGSSGVWGKHEWVLPAIDPAHVVSLGEGRTPLLPVPRLARDLGVEALWVKQCGTSATGSFKDLGMTVLMSQVNAMRLRGAPIRAVLCASTGDTSAALAAYGAAAGIPTVVLLPEGKISRAQLTQPLANGAIVLAVDADFDGCMRLVEALAEEPTFYLANSKNPLRIEGQKTVAVEMLEQLGWEVPDWVVIPCGNLGNLSALGKGFRLARELGLIDRLPRLLAAQAENANPLYRSYLNGFSRYEPMTARPTAATAIRIGNPVSYERAVAALRVFGGVVAQADERELADASAQADRHGLYTCPQTGVAFACLAKCIAEGTVGRRDRVVVVSTAHGLKFTEFKTAGADASSGIAAPGRLSSVIRVRNHVAEVESRLLGALAEAR